jgi:hypothetical protein
MAPIARNIATTRMGMGIYRVIVAKAGHIAQS